MFGSLVPVILLIFSIVLLSGCTSVAKINGTNIHYTSGTSNNPNIQLKSGILNKSDSVFQIYQIQANLYSLKTQLNEYKSKNYSKYELKQYMDNVKSFSLNLLSSLDQCDQNVGVYHVNCVDKETCTNLCGEASNKCSSLNKDYGTNMGNLVLSYIKLSSQLRSDATNIANMGSNPYILNDEEMFNYIKKTNDMLNVYRIFSVHPFVANTIFNLCSMANSNGGINISALELNGMNYENDKVVKDMLIIEKNEREIQSLPTYDIYLKSNCENKISINPTPTNTNGCSFEWSGMSVYPKQIITTIYTTDASAKNQNPQIDIEKHRIDLTLLAPIFITFDISNKMINNSATSLGIALGIYIVLIVILVNLLFTLYHIIAGIINKKSIHEGLWKSASNIPVTWKSDSILFVIMVIIAIVTSIYSRKLVGNNAMAIIIAIFNQGRYIAAIHVLSVIISLVLLLFIFQNKLRIYIMEKTYSKKMNQRLKGISDKANELLYIKLPKVKKSIDELSNQNVDVSDIMDKINIISQKTLFRIIEKPKYEDEDILKTYTDMLDTESRQIDVVKESIKQKYDTWKTKAMKIIKERNSTALNELPFIPKHLRVWFANKIIQDEPNVTFKDDKLSIVKVTYKTFASDLIKKDYIHGVMFYRNKILAQEFDSNLIKTVMASLGIKLGYALKRIGERFESRTNVLTSLGNKTVLLYANTPSINILLMVNKEHANETWTDIKKKIKEIKE